MFKIGAYVVKANNGVCVIKDVVHPDFASAYPERKYYLLVPNDSSSSRIYVPVDSCSENIRAVITEAEALDIIRRIPEIEPACIVSDKQREQFFKDTIRSLDPPALIGMMKNICRRRINRMNNGKKSTAVDDRYFKIAENTLYSELAFVLNRKTEEIESIIKAVIER